MTNPTTEPDLPEDSAADPEASAAVAADVETGGFGIEGDAVGLERIHVTSRSLELPKREIERLNFMAAREANPEHDRNVGFSARVWAQVTLPYTDPGNVNSWVRKNGPITLRVRPAAFTGADGSEQVVYPYGILPRHIMTWMATEAYRTGSPELILGSSMNAFMEKLGLSRGGKNRVRLRDQMQRVFGSQLSVEGIAFGQPGSGYGMVQKYFPIASETALWFSENEDDAVEGLWSSKIILSDPFFTSIQQHPIPVDLDVLKHLGSAPLRLDIYTWLGYRLYNLERPTRIKWADLYAQFGSQTKQIRDFRVQFKAAMLAIQALFPAVRYEIERDYFLLYPGPLPVPETARRYRIKG